LSFFGQLVAPLLKQFSEPCINALFDWIRIISFSGDLIEVKLF
jgi:hypothetical protein